MVFVKYEAESLKPGTGERMVGIVTLKLGNYPPPLNPV